MVLLIMAFTLNTEFGFGEHIIVEIPDFSF